MMSQCSAPCFIFYIKKSGITEKGSLKFDFFKDSIKKFTALTPRSVLGNHGKIVFAKIK